MMLFWQTVQTNLRYPLDVDSAEDYVRASRTIFKRRQVSENFKNIENMMLHLTQGNHHEACLVPTPRIWLLPDRNGFPKLQVLNSEVVYVYLSDSNLWPELVWPTCKYALAKVGAITALEADAAYESMCLALEAAGEMWRPKRLENFEGVKP